MSKLEEISESSDEMIFPCDCHDWHYLRISWEHDDRHPSYMWIEDAYRPHRWQDKLKCIWAMICNRPACHTEIILNDKTINSLQAFIESR